MKKVLSVITCSLLAACSCSDNQWEEVDVVNIDDAPMIEDEVVVETTPGKIIIEQEPVYTPAPQPAYNCPCTAVQPQPCYVPVCVQPCGCGCQPMPAPQPKITTTKKVITTTTTIEEPCGKPVCEPVVTTHEEILPPEVSTRDYVPAQPQVQTQVQPNNYVEVTVEKNPYRSEVVSVKDPSSKVGENVASKYSPEAYNVLATRATNRMLQDTSAIYDNGRTKTVYIKDTKLLSSDLPYGSQRLKGVAKEIISGAKAFDVVNNSNNADFIIDSSADWYVTDSAAPALQYKLAMFDKAGKKVNEWVEIIRQVKE